MVIIFGLLIIGCYVLYKYILFVLGMRSYLKSARREILQNKKDRKYLKGKEYIPIKRKYFR